MTLTVKAYLLLGTNLGNRLLNLEQAVKNINNSCGIVIKQSSLYETEAWGLKEQAAFINQAIEIETRLAPEDLLTEVKRIEREIGRVDTVKWGPRLIDIDILLYGNIVFHSDKLTVPHPYLHLRRFTLIPLNEIARTIMHPVLEQSIEALLEHCPDKAQVTRL